jgi:3-oxoacyl-[acyl-carrier protein] reductase
MTSAPSYVAPHGLLKDKTVLVTAAAGAGIGFSAAKRAAEEGCKALFISDVHERRLAEAVEQIKKDTGLTQVFGKLCDVSKEEQVQALISEADSAMGGIDVLINNAGLGTSCKVVDMGDDEWSKVIDITLTGTFRMTRAALKLMQPRGKGVIVNNASVLGWRAQTEQAHYAAAKAGVMASHAARRWKRPNSASASTPWHLPSPSTPSSRSPPLKSCWPSCPRRKPLAGVPSPGKWPM